MTDAYWTLPKAGRIRDALSNGLEDEVEDHLRDLGERYFVAFRSERIATHIECLHEAQETGLALRCFRNREAGMSEVVICTRDHDGLFAQIAGCFAAQLIDVNTAALFTRSNGITLDCFSVVNVARGRPLTEAQFTSVERVLKKVILERDDVDAHLARSQQRLFALRKPAVATRTKIAFDNTSSRTHTVIDIESGDRTGLLYDITRAISAHGLGIASAHVVTDARRVRDSFYIAQNNAKLEDKQQQEELREAILRAIHPRPTAETQGGTP